MKKIRIRMELVFDEDEYFRFMDSIGCDGEVTIPTNKIESCYVLTFKRVKETEEEE